MFFTWAHFMIHSRLSRWNSILISQKIPSAKMLENSLLKTSLKKQTLSRDWSSGRNYNIRKQTSYLIYYITKNRNYDLAEAGIEPKAAGWQSSALPSELHNLIWKHPTYYFCLLNKLAQQCQLNMQPIFVFQFYNT